jgi:hypothetical protein
MAEPNMNRLPTRTLALGACFALISIRMVGQERLPLNDQRIVDLVSMGVSQTEIIRIISSAQKFDFDLRPISTAAMLNAGVSEDVIKAMAAKTNGQPIVRAVTPPSGAPLRASQATVAAAQKTPTVHVVHSVQENFSQPPVNVSVATGPVAAAAAPAVPVVPPATAPRNAIGRSQITPNARLFIEPNEGFDTFLVAALDRKHVPLAVVADESQAEYVVQSANDSQKAGWARVIALGQTGSNEEASVRIVRVASGEVVWAYAVHKRNSFHGKQSSAEACAKHLKEIVK